MAERHRIHPAVDVEALLPSSSHAPSKPLQTQAAEKADHPPPPPLKKRRSCCCRCLCWTVLTVVILVVIIGAIVGILYLAFDPKLPKYSVDRLAISNFTVDDNMTVSATFNLTVTTTNPNKKIGIYYRGGSHLSAFSGTDSTIRKLASSKQNGARPKKKGLLLLATLTRTKGRAPSFCVVNIVRTRNKENQSLPKSILALSKTGQLCRGRRVQCDPFS